MIIIKKYPIDWEMCQKSLEQQLEDINPEQKNRLKLLDIGSGDGKKINYLTKNIKHKHLNIHYLDMDPLLEDKNKIVIRGDGGNLPFQSNSFDIVTSFHMIEHVNKKTGVRFLNEVHRVLKPGGGMILSTPNRHRPTSILNKVLAPLRKEDYPLNPDHIYEYTKNSIAEILNKSTFSKYHLTPCLIGIRIPLNNYFIHIGKVSSNNDKIEVFADQFIIMGEKENQI